MFEEHPIQQGAAKENQDADDQQGCVVGGHFLAERRGLHRLRGGLLRFSLRFVAGFGL